MIAVVLWYLELDGGMFHDITKVTSCNKFYEEFSCFIDTTFL